MRISILSMSTLSFILLCLSISTFGQITKVEYPGPTIEVVGKATVEVEPDYATISVSYERTEKDLNLARKAVESGVTAALALAKKYNIPAADVATRNISVSMKYISIREANKKVFDEDDDEIGTKEFVGYNVSRTVSIRLNKLSDFENLFNDILVTNPTEIDKVSFETTKRIELRERARTAAMKAAYDKAVAMTAAIGQKIGKAIRITEGNASEGFRYGILNSNSNIEFSLTSRKISADVASFSVGTVSVESSVTVVFSLD